MSNAPITQFRFVEECGGAVDRARLNTDRYSTAKGCTVRLNTQVLWFHMHVTLDLARVDSVTTTKRACKADAEICYMM